MPMLTILTQILFFTSFSLMANVAENEEIEVIARIQSQGDGIQIIRSNENDVITALLQNDQQKQLIGELKPGDEAIIKGRITYHTNMAEGQATYRPVFLITSIRPISLKRLGIAEREKLTEVAYPNSKSEGHYQRNLSFPISTEVASALTMTTTALLMSSLSAGSNQPEVAGQLNSGLIIFAGALATGVFIFEQIKGKGSK